jgi:hypothetical protein
MKAKDAISGKLYDLPQTRIWNSYVGAECYGHNESNDWMLFLTFDEWGDRRIRMVTTDTEVIPTGHD